MVKTAQMLLLERADQVEKVRAVKERLTANNRLPESWEANEKEEFATAMKALDAVDKQYQEAKSLHDNLTRFDEMNNLDDKVPDRQRQQAPNPGGFHEAISWRSTYNKAIPRQWNRSLKEKFPGTQAYDKNFNLWLQGSRQAELQLMGMEAYMASTGMSSDNEERGGYFITSESFMTEIIKQVDDAVFVQGLSRVIMMPPARSLGVRVRRARASTFTWQGENTDITSTRDTSLKYGKRYLTPHYLNGSTIISRDLLRNVPSSEGMVVEEIGVDFNYKIEPAFLFGDGNQKPLGLMTASNDGIDTTRDYTSTGGASTFTFDDFSNIKYSLKGKYRNRATWMLHRNVLASTAVLKDGMGQYLWQPSRQLGSPEVILGLPVVETEWMPYAVTGGMYFALLGDFSYYWIAYEMGMEMQRLVETQAKTNEVEYLFRCKLDAQPVLAEAFVRGKRN